MFDDGVPSLSATNSFTLTVMEVNSAPILTLPTNQTINELVLWTAYATAVDTDSPPNTLTFELVSGPSGLTVSSNGLISWTPTEVQGPSTNPVTIRVFDDGVPSLSTTNSFTLTVNEVNSPPVLPVLTNLTTAGITMLVVTNTAIDSDIPANSLTYLLLTGPTNAVIDTNGIITWTPGPNQIPGTNLFTTKVTDNGSPPLSTSNSFTVVTIGYPVITLASNQLVVEGCFPTNNAIDPGETVTVLFGLKNVGTNESISLVATLLATNGVVAPSGPQAYGTLPPDGSVVSQPFTFTASGTCGGTISPTLQLQEGTVNLGIVATTFSLGQSGIVLTQNFDTVTAPAMPLGWTNVATGGESPWVTRTTTNDTAPNAAYVPDPPSPGISSLETPAITLPLGQSRLTFRNNYNLEADSNGYYDGGVLEIRIGGGSYTDILTAGGSFVAGGYSGVISSGWDSPLAGRQAWSSNSAGFITTVVDLPASASGQIIQLRWLCASDSGNGNTMTNGWYIDSIAVTGWACCANTAPVIQSITISNDVIAITWSAVPGRSYQLQSRDFPTGTNWDVTLQQVVASGPSVTATNTIGSTKSRIYRVQLLP